MSLELKRSDYNVNTHNLLIKSLVTQIQRLESYPIVTEYIYINLILLKKKITKLTLIMSQ